MIRRRMSMATTALLLCALASAGSFSQAGANTLLAQLETEIQMLAADLSQSVVTVRAVRVNTSRGELREVYVGTGLVFDTGWVVTTPSVIASGVSYSVQAAGQVPMPAELVGYHADGQTAVFHVPGLQSRPVSLHADLAALPGQLLLVLGNAFGLEGALSWGIAAGARDDGLWQIGVSVAPGGSGSPVINTSGEVVGLVVAALTDAELNRPTAFAGTAAIMVPASRLVPLAQRLRHEGTVGRAYLGIRPETVEDELSRALGLSPGVLIGAVSFGSPAYGAGLRPGDVILELDHRPMLNEQALKQVLAEQCPGEEVQLSVVRNQQVHQFVVQLGTMPELLPARPAAPATYMASGASGSAAPSDSARALEAQIRLLESQLESLKSELDAP
jgi:S1-C subfamily serine protease